MEDVKWSHCYGWPTQKTHVKSGLIIMGDLPKWKMMVSLWWVTYPSERWKMKGGSHYNGRPTQRKTDEKRSHYNGWPTQMENNKRSHYNGWPTQMIECDLTGKKKKTWLEQSWQDKVDKPGTFWLQVDLKTPLDDGVNLLVSLRFSYWQGSSHSRIKIDSLLSSMQCFLLFPQSC